MTANKYTTKATIYAWARVCILAPDEKQAKEKAIAKVQACFIVFETDSYTVKAKIIESEKRQYIVDVSIESELELDTYIEAHSKEEAKKEALINIEEFYELKPNPSIDVEIVIEILEED